LKYFKRFHNYVKYVDEIQYNPNNEALYYGRLTKRLLALVYYLYYEKEHIYWWYNQKYPNYSNIIDINTQIETFKYLLVNRYKIEFKLKQIDDPSRFDLFNLIKIMNKNDTALVGW
jgi:hypothetical protein